MVTKVSVIVPVFNPGESIAPLIDSLLGQSMPAGECELIFVDDGSTDGTGARLDALANEHEHVTVEHIPNSGWPGRPRNIGLDLAAGEYVYFVDNDDWLGREALARLHVTARADEADIVIGKVVGHGKEVPRDVFVRNEHDLDAYSVPFSLLAPSKLFRRRLLIEHGIRFPEGRRRFEDHAFVVPAFFAARRISILADYACYHWMRRQDGSNASSLRTTDWSEYYAGVRQVLDIVDAHTEPGSFRDRLTMRWYAGKALGRLKGPYAEYPDDLRAALFGEARKLVEERFPTRLDRRLSHANRVRARLLRAGDRAGLDALARYERDMKAVVRVNRIRGDGTWLTVDIRAHLRQADGEPLRVVRRDGSLTWDAPVALRAHLAPGDLEIAGRLDAAPSRVILKSLDDGAEWDVVARARVSARPAPHDDPVRPHVRLRARIAPTIAAGGGPLPAGEYRVRAVISLAGFQSVAHARAEDGEPLTVRVTDTGRLLPSHRAEPASPPPPPPVSPARRAAWRMKRRVPQLLPTIKRARRAVVR